MLLNSAPHTLPLQFLVFIFKTKKVLILYGTVLGLSKDLSNELERILKERLLLTGNCNVDTRVKNVASYDPEDLENECCGFYVVVIMCTYANGSDPPSAAPFCKWISEATEDFRVGKGFLQNLGGFAVFGLGDSAYPSEDFCSASRRLSSGLANLGALQLLSDGERDASSEFCDQVFPKWCDRLVEAMATENQPNLRSSGSAEVPTTKKQTIGSNGAIQKKKMQEVIAVLSNFSSSLCFASLTYKNMRGILIQSSC